MNAPDIANINERKRRILNWNYEYVENLWGKKQHEHNKKHKNRWIKLEIRIYAELDFPFMNILIIFFLFIDNVGLVEIW